jgi:DNA-binding response OmpR family regulator
MGTTRVLLIESARHNGGAFSASLQRKYEVSIAHTGKQGLAMALESPPNVIVLDAASLRTSGDRISMRLREQLTGTPIIHIKPQNAERGHSVAHVMLFLPFTIRKLSNRIERYAAEPEAGKVRELGPFNLNLETRTLTTPWNEKKLTPKLVALMSLFLQHPDQTLERKHIMRQVWDTDYVEDTRTLDVHMRWLRQVVEPNPRKPKYLVTKRGVGYSFIISQDHDSDHKGDDSAQKAKSRQKRKATSKATD